MNVATTIVSSSSSNEGEVPRASHAAHSEAMRSGRASFGRAHAKKGVHTFKISSKYRV
jgi:hypothetical protein